MQCPCGHRARGVVHGQPRCGRHELVLTVHADGWMAGCHCGAAFQMPPGLEGADAEAAAQRLMVTHR